jgi:hypothetical protein
MSNSIQTPKESGFEDIDRTLSRRLGLPHVVMFGSFEMGFTFIGPFDGFTAAEAFVEEQCLEDEYPTVCINVLNEPASVVDEVIHEPAGGH